MGKEFTKEQIIDGLQELGFTLNDSKVYFTLLTLGTSIPANIAEVSEVDRARVYDSLKRLSKKNIIQEEPKKRAPQYRARPPEIIFDQIREELQEKITLTKKIEQGLKNYEGPSEETSVWTLSKNSLSKGIKELIQNAEEKISIILTPDISGVDSRFRKIVYELVEKKKNNNEVDVNIAFNVLDNENHYYYIKQMYREEIGIYKWESGPILPFGIYLSENSFIFTILIGVGGLPDYDFGFIVENPNKGMIDGFDHLVSWCLAKLCKRAIFEKKSKNN